MIKMTTMHTAPDTGLVMNTWNCSITEFADLVYQEHKEVHSHSGGMFSVEYTDETGIIKVTCYLPSEDGNPAYFYVSESEALFDTVFEWDIARKVLQTLAFRR